MCTRVLVYKYIGVQVYGCTGVRMGVQVYRCTNVWVSRCTSVCVYRGVQLYRCTSAKIIGAQMYRYTNVLVYRCVGVEMYGCTSVMVYKCMGVQQGWGQVKLTKYSSTPNIYQVQVLVKYSL